MIPCSNIDNVLVLDDCFVTNNLMSSSSRTRLANHRLNIFAASLIHINGGGMILDDDILLFYHSSLSTNMGHHFLGLHTHQNYTQQHHETTTTTTGSSQVESICCICLTEVSNSLSVVRMPQHCCSHVFHKDCIWKWISVRSTCPLCRRNVY